MATSSSHVVRNVDGIQLVGEEWVAEVHALLLSPGVDGYDARVYDHHHAHDEVVLLQHHVGDEGHEVQRVLLWAAQLRHHHQQVGPCKHGTAMDESEDICVSDYKFTENGGVLYVKYNTQVH